jgi:hypothetical protein
MHTERKVGSSLAPLKDSWTGKSYRFSSTQPVAPKFPNVVCLLQIPSIREISLDCGSLLPLLCSQPAAGLWDGGLVME